MRRAEVTSRLEASDAEAAEAKRDLARAQEALSKLVFGGLQSHIRLSSRVASTCRSRDGEAIEESGDSWW